MSEKPVNNGFSYVKFTDLLLHLAIYASKLFTPLLIALPIVKSASNTTATILHAYIIFRL